MARIGTGTLPATAGLTEEELVRACREGRTDAWETVRRAAAVPLQIGAASADIAELAAWIASRGRAILADLELALQRSGVEPRTSS